MASMTKEEMLKIAGVKPLIERVQFGAMSTDPRQIEGELELIIKQLTAARRGLGMANKLSPGSRERHKSMVMTNLI